MFTIRGWERPVFKGFRDGYGVAYAGDASELGLFGLQLAPLHRSVVAPEIISGELKTPL
jgi:hypothetical protein